MNKDNGLRNGFGSAVLLAMAMLVAVCGGGLKAQTVASLDSDTIALGDQTTLTISNTDLFPSTDMLSTGGIVALQQDFDTARRVQHTVITCFEPGEHYVHYAEGDSLPLMVTDVAIDTASLEPRDIMPPVKVPYTFWEIFRWVLLAWGVAAIGVVVWWLVERKRKHGSILVHHEPVDTRTPEERAIQSLEDLRLKRLWHSGKYKEYYTVLTDSVRQFIEDSTDIRATEMTSVETVEAVADRCPALKESLREIFNNADLVKFAKAELDESLHEKTMDEAVVFVREMWKLVKPAPENATDEAAKAEEEVKNA